MRFANALVLFAGVTVLSTSASADVLGQGGARFGVIRDLDADRVAGAGVGLYGDIRGFGLVMGIDYQNTARPIDDGVIFGHSLGLGVGFRFSPVSFVGAEQTLKVFDAYGAAVLDGGLVLRNGRTDRGARKSSYLAVGLELRPASKNIPALIVEHQWRQSSDEYGVGNTVLFGVAIVGSGRSELRD